MQLIGEPKAARMHDDTGDAETKRRRRWQLVIGAEQSRGAAGGNALRKKECAGASANT